MQETLLTTIPGTRDLLPEEITRWHLIEDRARNLFSRYGFQEIRTPVIEATELFARGIGGETDIVGKEMYTFRDQSGKSITLRPEATASVVRAYIQHALYRGAGLTKLYYIGPMFRHEKKQKGRWRQFYQIGAEALGSDHPAIEAEVIEMILALFGSLEVESRLLVNSVGCRDCRPGYLALLRQRLQSASSALCEDCRRRAETNPLRVFDCKNPGCQTCIETLPLITEHLCATCSEHFTRFRQFLEASRIPYEIVPRLVRGLDYYVRTAFEIVSGELGSQNALAGGGRYDGLSEVLGGPAAKGFGFALGLDRLAMILPAKIAEQGGWRPEVFVAYHGAAAFDRALALTRTLRQQGVSSYVEFDAASLKSQMRLANKLRSRHVLILGDEEMAKGKYPVRRMEDGQQWDVSEPELLAYLQRQTHESVKD
jgi:histidyl-tRNA synthetase